VFLTRAEFLLVMLKWHVAAAHIEANDCEAPDNCTGTLLLEDFPETWRSLDVTEVSAWIDMRLEERDADSDPND
jgi:hypothetical protein